MVAVRSTIRDTEILFGRFRLDADGQLWQGNDLIPIRPKPFAVLSFLLERAGRLVTKDELLDAIWPDVSVGEAVLKKTVGEIRDALSDEPKSPGYIETAHRRGYRFIADVTVRSINSATQANHSTIEQAQEARNSQASACPKVVPLTPELATTIVGRQDVMNQMMDWLESASRGERRVVFATGEAGIGKTALVEAFLQYAEGRPGTLVA